MTHVTMAISHEKQRTGYYSTRAANQKQYANDYLILCHEMIIIRSRRSCVLPSSHHVDVHVSNKVDCDSQVLVSDCYMSV